MKKYTYISIALLMGVLLCGGSTQAKKPKKKHHKKHSKKQKFDFCTDYVVVGLGGSGAVVARRLTDDFKTSVIGLEAGSNDTRNPAIKDPSNANFLLTQFFPEFFWQGDTKPIQDVNNRVFPWTNGRTFGGGMAVNGLQYGRGTVENWQVFEDALGDGWTVAEILARYKEIECYQGPQPINPARGTQGLWDNIALPANPTDDANFILAGLEQITGLPAVPDYNAPGAPAGPFSRWDLQVIKDMEPPMRESTATAFLGTDVLSFEGKGLNGRKLEVFFESTALSLIWDKCKKNKVIGVKFQRNGKCFTIRAKKEVIVCAGFRSAQFLQVNGIGPREVLEKAGVRVRVDNRHVGSCITNHPIVTGVLFSTPNADFIPVGEEKFVYFTPGAFLPDPSQPGLAANRGIQWISLPILGATPEQTLWTMIPLLLFPKSKGTIEIQDADPLKIPIVNLNYLSDTDGPNGTSADLNSFKVALRGLIPQLAEYFQDNRPAWQLIQPSLVTLEDDALLEEFIKNGLSQAHHWCQAVFMAILPEDGAVDPRGRVFGVQGLRVADDSILIIQMDINLGGPAILVGWTIAEFIINGD